MSSAVARLRGRCGNYGQPACGSRYRCGRRALPVLHDTRKLPDQPPVGLIAFPADRCQLFPSIPFIIPGVSMGLSIMLFMHTGSHRHHDGRGAYAHLGGGRPGD